MDIEKLRRIEERINENEEEERLTAEELGFFEDCFRDEQEEERLSELCMSVANLARFEENRNAFASLSMPLISARLTSFLGLNKVRYQALRAIGNLCFEHAEYRLAFARAG